MAIMQSCCCWQSVRRGSFACAVYTGIYFAMVAATTGTVLQAEHQYLTGNRSLPESSSLLEPETISPTTVRFNVILLICSCCGVVCSLLLLYGLFKDQRVFLIPWIVTVIACGTVDVAHSLYLFIVKPNFTPITAMLYTLNFFLLCLNTYSLLCVISQYQEYLAGRGTAADDYENRVPVVRYAIQPTTTATSCLSSRRAATNNETKASPTPTQSPTAGQNTPTEKNLVVIGRPTRKHVQFPDTSPPSQQEKSEILSAVPGSKWNQETGVVKSASSFQPPNNIVAPTIMINQSLESTNSNPVRHT